MSERASTALQKKRQGLTVVEILVVIALLASLTAMLLPVFIQAKRPANSTVCLTNLHSIGVGIGLYASDADGLYPMAVDPSEKSPTTVMQRSEKSLLSDVLQSYLKSRAVWRCPLDDGVAQTQNGDAEETGQGLLAGTKPSVFEKFGMSYGYDSRFGGLPHPITLYDRDDKTVHGPAEVTVCMDLLNLWHGTLSRRQANVLFADDHVKLVAWPKNVQSGGWLTAPRATRD